MAAQQALSDAALGRTIDNLVLIGAPINQDLYNAIMNNPNISNVVIVNINGDPMHPGITALQIDQNTPTLISQMNSGTGYFYFAGSGSQADARRSNLTQTLYNLGIR